MQNMCHLMTRFCEVARVCLEVIEINNNIKVNSEISDNQSFYLCKDLEFCFLPRAVSFKSLFRIHQHIVLDSAYVSSGMLTHCG